MSNNVTNIFSRVSSKEEEKEESSLDLEEIAKQNAIKAERIAKDRVKHNRRVTNDYKLKPRK